MHTAEILFLTEGPLRRLCFREGPILRRVGRILRRAHFTSNVFFARTNYQCLGVGPSKCGYSKVATGEPIHHHQ